jgi:hypothetical protein
VWTCSAAIVVSFAPLATKRARQATPPPYVSTCARPLSKITHADIQRRDLNSTARTPREALPWSSGRSATRCARCVRCVHPRPAPSEPVSVSTRRTGLHHEYAGGRWSPWCVQLTRTCQRWVLGHSRPPSRDFNASTTVSLKRFRAQRSNGLYCCEGRSILRLRAQLPVSAHSPPPGRLWAWGDLQRHRQAHISYMVLPVAPSEAARAPRLEMVPGEALMAGYAYNDSLKRYPNSFQWGVEQLQVRFEPHCSYIAPLCSFSVHSLPSAPECTECRRG